MGTTGQLTLRVLAPTGDNMTKKDYEMIAEVLKYHIHLEWNNLNSYSTSIAEDLAVVFAKDNERFDHKKFMEACTPV